MEHNIEKALVSIVVVTYNSSKYIQQTLESILNQSYSNVELVISDDASTDDTVLVCENWIKTTGSDLKNVELITVNNNTGISQNLNRGVEKSKGVWIKPLAGDDILAQNCIEINMGFVQNTDIDFVGSDRLIFEDSISNFKLESNKFPLFGHPKITSEIQYEAALRGFGLPQCTWFYRRSAIIKIGLYDEKYPMMEDWPIKLKVLKSGEKIYYNPIPTVYYRTHSSSISHGSLTYYTSWKIDTYLKVKKELMSPYLPLVEKVVLSYESLIIRFISKTVLNRRSRLNKVLNYILIFPVKALTVVFTNRLKKKIELELKELK